MIDLKAFLRESLKIEGIHRAPTRDEIVITSWFLALVCPTVGDVQRLVDVYAPGSKLRRHPGMDVQVGRHFPPRGGTGIEAALIELLNEVNAGKLTPYQAHIRYESLHPFMDGNGRSGRTIWLWQMRYAPLGFLHHFYYQVLGMHDATPLRQSDVTINKR